jgi:hypothetical protein
MSNAIGLYVTYERFTPESLDQGMSESRGWWDSGDLLFDDKPDVPAFIFDPELDYDEEEHPSVIDAAVVWAADRLKREGATQPSSTEDPEWWSTEPAVIDYKKGVTLARDFHFHGFSDEQVEAINCLMFGNKPKTIATRKVDITLRALTAVECTVTVDVPVDADEADLTEIAHELFENKDGSDFEEDNEYWEEGTHSFNESLVCESEASGIVECSVLHLIFRVPHEASPGSVTFQELISEADYEVSHHLIEGTEIIETEDETHRVTVSARLHHSVTESGAQEVAESLSHSFLDAETGAVFASELVEVEFPAWA